MPWARPSPAPSGCVIVPAIPIMTTLMMKVQSVVGNDRGLGEFHNFKTTTQKLKKKNFFNEEVYFFYKFFQLVSKKSRVFELTA